MTDSSLKYVTIFSAPAALPASRVAVSLLFFESTIAGLPSFLLMLRIAYDWVYIKIYIQNILLISFTLSSILL